ncbi:ATP-binding cassette domain-containing protein [Mycobacterium parmense]|nr:ATP-binding cassette domain-containing protein [Mycobacterium parmense]
MWAGPSRYVFAPGRDVVVGYGPGCDVPLDHLVGAGAPPRAHHQEMVLRFTGTGWVALNRSPSGIFVNGAPASTVEIRDGQAITIGDPQRGPRLVFALPPRPGPASAPQRTGPPTAQSTPPAGPGRPRDPRVQRPTQRETQQMPVAPGRPTAGPPGPPAPRPPAPAPPVPPVPVPPPQSGAADEESGLIKSLTTRKLRAQRPSFRAGEPDTTYRLPLRPGARTVGVAAYQLGLVVDGREVLASISFTARTGTLTAITGPSAARNSALLNLISGARKPSFGAVTVDGHDVHAEPASMRSRIGIVGRNEALHPRLTVGRALEYAAELRLPPDTPPEHRGRVVNQVLEELDLAPHRATQIRALAPEVRRCAALAVELVTRPTLLVVDDPGAGLDAAQQDHVMAALRRQADIGCAVVAAVSPRAPLPNLNLCDQVLLLTSAGRPAYLGTPLQVEASMGTADWSTLAARAGAEPEETHRAYRARQQALTAPPQVAPPWPPPTELTRARQVRLVARRDLRLLLADRVRLAFLVALPFLLASLTLLIPGGSGLERPRPGSPNMHEAVEILAALNVAAVLIGTALTIGTLVGERRAFRREQAVGLSATAYLTAKLLVFGAAAAILTAATFAVVIAARGGPTHGAVLLHNATVELYLSVALTAVVSAVGGLLLSTLGKSLREVLPLVVPVVLASALFAGGLISLVGTWGYDQISWLVPAQWGFAASASVVDLRRVDTLAADVEMWTHYSGWWVFDITMLVFFGAVLAGLTRYRLRRPGRAAKEHSSQRDPSVS